VEPAGRVLHVVPGLFGESGEFFGGAERYSFELALAMSRLAPTTLLTFASKNSIGQIGDLELITLKNWINVRRFRFDPFNPMALLHLKRAAVIHCHQTHKLMTGIIALRGRVFGKPVFTTDLGGGGVGLHQLVDTDGWFAGHLHISQFSRDQSGQADLSSARVIYGGIDAHKFRPDPAAPDRTDVLFVGRLLPHKGIDYLIEGADPETPVKIIGRPFRHAMFYYEYLLKLAEHKNVTFLTNCTDEDLIKAYQRALCVVLPSVYDDRFGDHHSIPELLGLTLLEGMSCETPALCTNVGSLPEIVVDHECGFIVPPNSADALGEKLSWLKREYARGREMGAAARRRAMLNFSWDTAAAECLKAYDNAE
jgi:glycosyltransferase involved in cell wall biosynthesis